MNQLTLSIKDKRMASASDLQGLPKQIILITACLEFSEWINYVSFQFVACQAFSSKEPHVKSYLRSRKCLQTYF